MKKLVFILIAFVLGTSLICVVGKPPSSEQKDSPAPENKNHFNKSEPLPPEQKAVLPDFVEVKVHRNSEKGTVYGDIISHSKDNPYGDGHGRTTNAHETTHGINSEIRMAHPRQRVNGFYVLNGKGVVVEEPGIKMEHAVLFIPQNLRSYRYGLYMEEQIKQWNDMPTYICDEWTAYVNGGSCAVDDVNQGKHTEGWTDGVSGCLDFSVYTVSLCMAIKKHDPEYWNDKSQFRNFVIWQMKRAQAVFLKGRVMKEFKWKQQDKLLLELLTSDGAKPIRDFLQKELGGLWLDIDPKEIKNTSYEGTPM
jgi:hypothetical protein